jgi:DNA-binding FadR family transcriptional regulator
MPATAPRKAAVGTKARLGSNGVAGFKVRTPKTSELIADHIRGQIVRGELLEGDSLPPEGELMETLGISRPTLREAFRILEAEKLISVVRGSRSGATVHQPHVDVAARYAGYVLQSQGATIADLYAAQQAIEPFVVRTLCRTDSRKAVAALRKHVAKLSRELDENRTEDFIADVSEFHRVLVEVAGNKTLTFLNQLLLNLLMRHQNGLFKARHRLAADAQRKQMQAGFKSFQKLIQLIEDKEEEAAVAHWRLHLKHANVTWAGEGEGERTVDALGG